MKALLNTLPREVTHQKSSMPNAIIELWTHLIGHGIKATLSTSFPIYLPIT